MKRLSKERESRRSELVGNLQELEACVTTAVNAFNEAVQEANEFREEIHSDQENYYDERSERWQDGDAGQEYSDWKDEWSEELEALEMPDMEHAEKMENLPGEAGGC